MLLLCIYTLIHCTPVNHIHIYRYGPVVIKSVTTVTGDGSLLRRKADAILRRSSGIGSMLKPPALITAVLAVDVESSWDTSWYGLWVLLADNSLGVE